MVKLGPIPLQSHSHPTRTYSTKLPKFASRSSTLLRPINIQLTRRINLQAKVVFRLASPPTPNPRSSILISQYQLHCFVQLLSYCSKHAPLKCWFGISLEIIHVCLKAAENLEYNGRLCFLGNYIQVSSGWDTIGGFPWLWIRPCEMSIRRCQRQIWGKLLAGEYRLEIEKHTMRQKFSTWFLEQIWTLLK